MNGRAVEVGSIVAPTLNKKERQRLRKQLREKAKEEGGEDAESDDDDSSGEEDASVSARQVSKTTGSGPRILAVDWALSKDKWEEAKAKTLGEELEVSGAGSESESGSDSEEDPELGSESGEAEGHWEDYEERSDAEEAVKPTLPQTDVGTTLFVRNLPFDATEDELRVL